MEGDGALGGELRSLCPNSFVRGVRIALGFEALAACTRQILRLLLRAERWGEVRIESGTLRISERRSILGRALPERHTVLPLSELVSISVFDRRAELLTNVGLGALAAGTLLGMGVFTQGLRAAGFAPSLLAIGLLLAAVGGLVDFALARAAERARANARSTLRIVPTRGPGILLLGLQRVDATAWLDSARTHLAPREPA